MEEVVDYIYDDVVGNIHCKYDGRLWWFEDSRTQSSMIIPAKSISNVQFVKVSSSVWLIFLIFALVSAAITGVLLAHNDDKWLLFCALTFFCAVIAIILKIFSVQYMISVIPHSRIEQKIVSTKSLKITNLYRVLTKSLRKDLKS
ncbi:MAG: hypothetical protein PUG15_07265 [Bacteroidales bacterium]|nr:hypothetical protein [Bacteroidales bacterium]